MTARQASSWLWPALGLAAACAGSAVLLQVDAQRRQAAFDTDARIAHRLLSQQAVQHDAILATLTLLQPGSQEPGDEQRLPALYPQVLQVMRRAREGTWPSEALARAEAESARTLRAVVAEADVQRGQYTLVRAGQPASYALRIDVSRVIPWAEWPMVREGPVQARLLMGGSGWVIQPGHTTDGVHALSARKTLASDSQAFELQLSQTVPWSALPWGTLLLWNAAVAAAVVGLMAWRRQQQATRRAQELLRLGQVGRLSALGELAAGMAHELNQPLTAVLASTQAAQRLLDDEEPDLTTARQALAQGAQQARRAADVVGRLRRLVQAPDADAAPQTIAVASAVRQVLDLMQPQAQGVQVDLSALDDSVAVRADPVALEQILHNLLLNAQQALESVPPSARNIAVACRAQGQQAVIQLSDTGPGFPAGSLSRAFEPFFTTRPGGLGLGLSLCDSLAAGMGGQLSARNRSDGGAELSLTLPLAAGHAQA